MTEMNTLGIKDLEEYSVKHTKPIHPILDEIREYTIRNVSSPQMMVGPLEGKFLQLMCALSSAKTIVEVGTFTGYSTLCFADAVGPGGHVITIDTNPQTSGVAQSFIHRAGFEERVSFAIGDAQEVIDELEGPFDLAFIDADKGNYDLYFEMLLPKIKTAGFLIFDNMLWSGGVLNPVSAEDFALAELNQKLTSDSRVENFLLPLRDGIQIVQKL